MNDKDLREQVAQLIWANQYGDSEWMAPDNEPYLKLADQVLSLMEQARGEEREKVIAEIDSHILSVKTDLPRPFSKGDLIKSIKEALG